jgi:hypothetical protein
MVVRPFVESDLGQVVSLYWNHMRGRDGAATAQLADSFRELYFSNPWFDRGSPSFVSEDKDGKIVGFLGVIARRMCLGGRPIRAAFGGNFIVQPKARASLAAVRLLEAFVAGSHDLLLADSANDITRRIAERLGFQTIPALNIHWARPLRPTHYGVYALSKAMGRAASASLRFAAKPFCLVADGIARRFAGPTASTKVRLQGSELDAETLHQCLVEFRSGYLLWTESDARFLNWLLSFVQRNRERGQLRKVAVRDENQRIVGWYIYYVKRGAAGEVLQIGGDPKFSRDILVHLFEDARNQGLVALHGVADFKRMADFSDEGCFFTCRGGWALARARTPELIDALKSGNGRLSRLDGEWCLNPGE